MDNISFETPKYKVFIKTDSVNRIILVNSSIFITDTTEWIEIDEGNGDKYAHAQSQYLDKPLYNFDGTHNYKYIDNEVVETTEEEKAEERATFPQPPKSDSDRIKSLEEENEQMAEVLDALLMGEIEV